MFYSSSCCKVIIKHLVCRSGEATFHQVHQQKRKIVQDIARCNYRIELDRIERDRLAIQHRNIAEMKVTMPSLDEPLPAASQQQWT